MSEEEIEIEVEAIAVEVSSQPIELYKVLKIANAVNGGGEAKMAISEGYVAVNGELEQRKRRKMYDGDVLMFNDEYYVVICEHPVLETSGAVEDIHANSLSSNEAMDKPEKSKDKKKKKSKKSKAVTKTKDKAKDQNTGRKTISF